MKYLAYVKRAFAFSVWMPCMLASWLVGAGLSFIWRPLVWLWIPTFLALWLATVFEEAGEAK